MPITREGHERRLRERGLFSEPHIETTLKRADLYAEYNQEHPGFFDMYINSGKLIITLAEMLILFCHCWNEGPSAWNTLVGEICQSASVMDDETCHSFWDVSQCHFQLSCRIALEIVVAKFKEHMGHCFVIGSE
jgi:hypothetical protein